MKKLPHLEKVPLLKNYNITMYVKSPGKLPENLKLHNAINLLNKKGLSYTFENEVIHNFKLLPN